MKRFKDTKLYSKLKVVLPHVVDFVGDVLPDKGVLGVLKNLIEKEEHLSDEHKLDILKEVSKELLELEINEPQIQPAKDTDDLVTKRARPLRQYSWILLLFICYPLSVMVSGSIIELPEIVLMGMFADMGIYSILRTTEKGGFPLKEVLNNLFKRR